MTAGGDVLSSPAAWAAIGAIRAISNAQYLNMSPPTFTRLAPLIGRQIIWSLEASRARR
jgi:hypothetical protein